MSVTAVPIQPVKRSYLLWLWLAVLLAVGGGAALAWQGTRNPEAEFFATNAARKEVVTTASGLQYEVLQPGSGGASPTDADIALIQYEGKLLDGSPFDKSEQPTPMPVAGVVPGFSEGLKKMQKGAKYRFWIKPELAYGADEKRGPDGKVVIPANSVLVFDVELMDFLPEAVVRQMQMGAMPPGAGGPGGAPQQIPPQPQQ